MKLSDYSFSPKYRIVWIGTSKGIAYNIVQKRILGIWVTYKVYMDIRDTVTPVIVTYNNDTKEELRETYTLFPWSNKAVIGFNSQSSAEDFIKYLVTLPIPKKSTKNISIADCKLIVAEYDKYGSQI